VDTVAIFIPGVNTAVPSAVSRAFAASVVSRAAIRVAFMWCVPMRTLMCAKLRCEPAQLVGQHDAVDDLIGGPGQVHGRRLAAGLPQRA